MYLNQPITLQSAPAGQNTAWPNKNKDTLCSGNLGVFKVYNFLFFLQRWSLNVKTNSFIVSTAKYIINLRFLIGCIIPFVSLIFPKCILHIYTGKWKLTFYTNVCVHTANSWAVLKCLIHALNKVLGNHLAASAHFCLLFVFLLRLPRVVSYSILITD